MVQNERDETDASDPNRLCAHITYGNRACGYYAGGRPAYVQNRRKDTSVRATVEGTWHANDGTGTWQETKTLPPRGPFIS